MIVFGGLSGVASFDNNKVNHGVNIFLSMVNKRYYPGSESTVLNNIYYKNIILL